MSGLILPPSAQPQIGHDSHIDMYDSDMLKLEAITAKLNQRYAGTSKSYEDMDQMYQEEYRNAGFDVDIKWNESVGHGLIPTVQVNGRLDKAEFDHDQMVKEVTDDILGIANGGGVIHSE